MQERGTAKTIWKDYISAPQRYYFFHGLKMPYSILKHLSVRQALDHLKSQYAINLKEEDLLSYCEEGHCPVYIETPTECGWAEDSDEDHYGVGYQLLLNPKDLLSPGGEIVLHLQGEVRYESDVGASVFYADEWKMKTQKTDIRVRILRTDLEALGTLLKSTKKRTSAASSGKAELLMIAGMIDIITTHTTRRTQDRIADELIATFPVSGMSKRVINGIFAEAKKAKKALGLPPPIK